MLKVIELFAGIGSQTQALKNIGVEHEVVAISEIDKYALISYAALHGEPNNLGDITKIASLPQADLWTYSFPCQDISVAGKLAGIKEGTRSGLLFHVERLLKTAVENETLPKYLLLENVKNLVGKKFKASFDRWLAFLSELGYSNYWQVLNAKHYGIPQNRDRVFCVSIRGNELPYTFPKKQELKLRLRDLIDEVVEEKYYLSDRALNGILTTTFNQRKRQINNTDICNTLCARDYKEPQCVNVGQLCGEKWEKMHDISRRVYGTEGIAPTVHCSGGGNTEPKIIEDFYKARPPRVYEDICPTLRSEREGLKVVAGQFQPVDRDYNKNGTKREEHFECRKDEVSNAVLTGDRKNCVKIVAMRGRNPDNPSDRTPGIHLAQTLEENSQGLCNALTTVQKDNLVMESSLLIAENTKKGYAEASPGDGINIQYPTSTTRRGRVGKGISNTVMCSEANAVVTDNVRIRKLTPRECLRLMGWYDRLIDKIVATGISNSQMYRQAGNGIVVQVLEAIFRQLFFFAL